MLSVLRFALFLLLILPLFPVENARALDTINLGPLFYMEKDGEKGTKKIDALGPFVSYKRGEHEKEYGLRPIFYNYKNYKKDMTSFDFLYPLSTHRTFEGDTKFQMLVYIFFYRSDIRPSGFVPFTVDGPETAAAYAFARVDSYKRPDEIVISYTFFFGLEEKGEQEEAYFVFAVFILNPSPEREEGEVAALGVFSAL